MMQNNLMGGGMAGPATAPANPTGLNFQSDPSMRAQFKGFMSGMQAKQPAPMAPSPMQAPLPMPAPMQNVDIFQPQPMQMQMGGAVPRQAMMGGMPHMLSYITPGEAAALSAMGGTGQPGPGGVPSFVYDEAGMGGFSSGVGRDSGPSMGDASFDYSGGGDNDFNVFEDSRDSFTVGPVVDTSLSADRAATQDALSTLLAADALQQDRQRQEDLARDITKRSGVPEITEGFGPMSQVVGTTQTPFANNNVKSIRDSVDTIFDIDTTAPDLLSLDAFGPNTPNLDFSDPTLAPTNARTVDIANPIATPDQIKMQQSLAADARRELGTLGTGPIGIPDEIQMRRDANAALNAPVTAPAVDTGSYDAIPNSIQQTIRDNLGAQNLGAMGEGSFPSAPSVPASDGIVRTEAGSTNRIADSGFGPGEVYMAKGANQPADRQGFFDILSDTISGREFPTEDQIGMGIDKALDAQTTVLLSGDKRKMAPRLGTEDAATRSALEQLAERATPTEGGGILGAFTNFGARNAANMYNDIVNNGYEPVYDRSGQIIQTRVPGTNILGSGSRPSDDFTGGGGGGSAPRPVQAPQPSVADLVATELAKLQPAAPAPTQTAPTPMMPAPVNAGPRAPATGGSSLGFGYGQLRRIPGISSNLNTAADDFLNLLGGSNVQNFARGGNVSNDLDAFGGAGPDVGFEGSGRGTFSGGSYSENPFDSGGDDDYIAPTVAPGGFITNQSSQDDGYNINTAQANQMNQQAKRDAVARDIAMDEQRRSVEAAQRDQSLRASIDRLNQLQAQVNAPRQGIMSAAADLLGFGGQQNMLTADLAAGGATPQSMTPNTSVMGYNDLTGQTQTGAANQSIVQSADPSQAGLAGTMNVPTSRDTGFFDAVSSMASNLPSLSEIGNRILGAPIDHTKLNIGGSGNSPFQSR